MCVQMVQQKVDTVAGAVVTAMLQLSRPHETRLQEDRSAPLAETAISAAVAEANESRRSSQLSSEKVSGESFSTCRRLQPLTWAPVSRRHSAPSGGRHVRGMATPLLARLSAHAASSSSRASAKATAAPHTAST